MRFVYIYSFLVLLTSCSKINVSIRSALFTSTQTETSISGVTVPGANIYYAGDVLSFTLAFTGNVTVTGTPTLDFTIGGSPAQATYISGSGTSQLLFQYVVADDVHGVGPVLSSPLNLAGGSITNAAGDAVDITFTSPDMSGVLIDGRSLLVNFSNPSPIVDEASGLGRTLTLTLSGIPLVDYSFTLKQQGNAIRPTDYNMSATSIVIPAGQSSVTIPYDVFDNGQPDSRKFFDVSLDYTAGRSNALLGNHYHAKVSIFEPTITKDRFKSITTGVYHACAITTDDELKCWGDNTYGQVGDGSGLFRAAPVVVDAGQDYKVVSGRAFNTCGITDTNQIKCWAWSNPYTPTLVDSGITYKHITTSANLYCAITTADELKCWGSSTQGALGAGSTTSSPTPLTIDSGVTYKTVSGGDEYTCGITTDDVLKCWGRNTSRQLGDGTNVSKNTPQIIDSGVGFKKVNASPFSGTHTCGITTNDELKCWGGNSQGQLGDGTTTFKSLPVIIDPGTAYSDVAVGNNKTCAITNTGVLKCWGEGTSTPTVMDLGVNYVDVSANQNLTCAVTVDGLAKCWGNNERSQLGNGSRSAVATPMVTDPGVNYRAYTSGCGITMSGALKCWGTGPVGDGTSSHRPLPVTIDPGVSYSAVTLGCAITTTNVLKCWGDRIGDGTSVFRLKPTVIDPGVSYVSVSQFDDASHACGITVSGRLNCWGVNTYGQLGNGTNTNSLSPVEVDPGVAYRYVSAGYTHTCGITTAGVLKCWGLNTKGAVGDSTLVNRNSPTVIDTGVQYKSVSTGYDFSCGITSDDTLKCWGSNSDRQLGDGTNATRNAPVPIDGVVTYKSISAGAYSTCGITTSDQVKCWGSNIYGELGNGTYSTAAAPTLSDFGATYKSVSMYDSYACGITSSDQLKCWGNNNRSQLGNNLDYRLPIPVGDY